MRLVAVILALSVCACGDGGSDEHAAAPTPTATATPRAGTLDVAFGAAGITTTDFDGRGDVASAIAVQPDGRIVVAGQSLPLDGRGGFAAARYLPDGTLDTSFGDGGRVSTPPPAQAFSSATDVAVDAAGRVLLAGSNVSSPATSWQVVRYTPRGEVDTSFGTDGVVGIPEAAGGPVSLVPEPDGAILVAGTRYLPDAQIAVARVLDDGRLDDAFGADGIAAVGPGAFDDLVLGPDGTIVVGGVGTVAVDGFLHVAFRVARLLRDGTPDPSFGDGGIVATAIGQELGQLLAVAVGADGAIVAAGYAGPLPSHGHGFFGSLVLARYDATGALDPTFGDAGLIRTDVIVSSSAVVALDPSGPIYIADATVDGQPFSAARVRRLDAAGVLDPTFGDDGTFLRHLRPDDESAFQALALRPDGRLLAAGYSRLTLGDYDFALARLWR